MFILLDNTVSDFANAAHVGRIEPVAVADSFFVAEETADLAS